jgi:TonB family protein
VQFQVRRDGKIESMSLKATAGNDELDQAALKAVRDSSPFDPLPTNFKGPCIELRFSFAYSMKTN